MRDRRVPTFRSKSAASVRGCIDVVVDHQHRLGVAFLVFLEWKGSRTQCMCKKLTSEMGKGLSGSMLEIKAKAMDASLKLVLVKAAEAEADALMRCQLCARRRKCDVLDVCHAD